MTEHHRPYRSKLRDEQAAATRRRIVAAGRDLFVERGYGATTIDALAERAGVSRKTVFTAVGGKAAVLKLAFDWTLAGDDEPVPIAARPQVRRMMQGTDPAVLLAEWMAMNAAIAGRLAMLYHVLVIAADTDPPGGHAARHRRTPALQRGRGRRWPPRRPRRPAARTRPAPGDRDRRTAHRPRALPTPHDPPRLDARRVHRTPSADGRGSAPTLTSARDDHHGGGIRRNMLVSPGTHRQDCPGNTLLPRAGSEHPPLFGVSMVTWAPAGAASTTSSPVIIATPLAAIVALHPVRLMVLLRHGRSTRTSRPAPGAPVPVRRYGVEAATGACCQVPSRTLCM